MDLSTRYLSMTLKNPIVPSPSPLSMTLDGIRRLEEAGAGAIVMYSLFEEQLNQEPMYLDNYLAYGTENYAEALSYFPGATEYSMSPDGHLELLAKAKQAVGIPIIGSLNGVSTGGWITYAKEMEQAGADALELNIYYLSTDIRLSGSDVEEMHLEALRDVKRSVSIPVSVKLSPFFSSVAYMARRLAEIRADGLVLFNRFYQPDFDLDQLSITPGLSFSGPHELRLPLTWAAILYGRVPLDLAITTGVHTHLDVLKGLMAGAKVMMMASELLERGLGRIGEILAEMERWMEAHQYKSVMEIQGMMSQLQVKGPAAFERANYMKVLQSYPGTGKSI